LKLKKLETMALEFVPLSEQHVLLDFEEYKDQLLKVQTKQKQRRKKEERWRLWGET
jgi:chemotaxis response regulator CheB